MRRVDVSWARSTMEAAMRAALRLREVMGALEWLDAGQCRRGGDAGRAPGPTDPSDAWDARIDRRADLRREASSLRRQLACAGALVGGVRAAMPATGCADALELRFLRAMGWGEVAAAMGVSRMTAMRRADVAIDWLDAVGPARALAGAGVATDADTQSDHACDTRFC